jgi:Tfp pilus assembly protein PilE
MRKENGFTLVEMLVAMTLFIIIVFVFAPAFAFYYKEIATASQGEQHIFDVNEEINEQLALRERNGADNPFDLTFTDGGSFSEEGKVFGRNIAVDGVTTIEAAAVDAEGNVRYRISVAPDLVVAAYDGTLRITATFDFDSNPSRFSLKDKDSYTVSGAVFSISDLHEAWLDLKNVALHPDKGPYTVTYNGPDENGVNTDFTSSFAVSRYPYIVVTADGQYYYGSLNTAGDMELIDMKDQIATGAPKFGELTPENPRLVSDIIWDWNGSYYAGALGDSSPRDNAALTYPPRLARMSDLTTWETLPDLSLTDAKKASDRIYEVRRLYNFNGGEVTMLGRYLDPAKTNRVTRLHIDTAVNAGNATASDIALDDTETDGTALLWAGQKYNAGAKDLLYLADIWILAGQAAEWVDEDGYDFNRGRIIVSDNIMSGDGKSFIMIGQSEYLDQSEYVPLQPPDEDNRPGYYTGVDRGTIDGNMAFVFTTYKRWEASGAYLPGVIVCMNLDMYTNTFTLSQPSIVWRYADQGEGGISTFTGQYGLNDVAFGNGTADASQSQKENWVAVGERGLIMYRDIANGGRFVQTIAINDSGSELAKHVRESLVFTRVAFLEGSFYAMGYRGNANQTLAPDGSRNDAIAPLNNGEHYAVLYQSKDGGRTWNRVSGLNAGFVYNGDTYATEVVGIASRF